MLRLKTTTAGTRGLWVNIGLGTQKDNREGLGEFYQRNGLVTGTLFPHKDIHRHQEKAQRESKTE